MTWRRYLTEIALAGGLAGGCAAQMMGGCTSTPGGTTVPPCNANPDPCCPCSEGSDGLGGYGGAACLGSSSDPTSCQSALDCAATPTVTCCAQGYAVENATQTLACNKAGFGSCQANADCAQGLVCSNYVCAVGAPTGGSGGAGGSTSSAGSGGAGGAGGAGAGGASDGGA